MWEGGKSTNPDELSKLSEKITVVKPNDKQLRKAYQVKKMLQFIEDNLTFDLNSNNPANTLMLNMLGAFAEFERDLIVTRTQEGKEWAKKNNPNFEEGRPERILNKKYLLII